MVERVLSNCQKSLLDEQDWSILKQRFIQTAEDITHVCWDNAPRLFFDNRSSFEYNMGKLKSLGTPIARIKAAHNCSRASKRDSTSWWIASQVVFGMWSGSNVNFKFVG